MSDLVSGAAAVYAVIFTASAIGKADDWSSWSSFVIRLMGQSPRFLQRISRLVVPTVEMFAAVVLLFRPGTGLLLASLLFLVFVLVPTMRYKHLRGQPCACFGAIHHTDVGRGLIVRNLVLACTALSLGIAAPPRLGPIPLLAVCSAALALLTIVAALKLRADARTFSMQFGLPLIAREKERS